MVAQESVANDSGSPATFDLGTKPVAVSFSIASAFRVPVTLVVTSLSIGVFISSTFILPVVVSPACSCESVIVSVTLKYSGLEFVIYSEISAPILFELFRIV